MESNLLKRLAPTRLRSRAKLRNVHCHNRGFNLKSGRRCLARSSDSAFARYARLCCGLSIGGVENSVNALYFRGAITLSYASPAGWPAPDFVAVRAV
ncbi:hypothetical protein G3N95_03435 [Paraburkholderia sp. Tr-20389]|uniref:hypothetical protein n=1 Tax=Paraburkholderia sp. Tr-20389 TaxID=2703903 RepID=UPI0019818D4C|nr:hypothetical protein [Paraburkholderia sp. Tr-20389]MBN3751978.1 hypothetical protein [Paraburkholderia sp. Tr-20389]